MRFSRTRLLLGEEGFERLRRAQVVVFGLGGVGSYAFEALARAGVGTLFVVDFDVVEPSNINRQLLALDCTLGRAKVELARERLEQINPDARLISVNEFLTAENVERLIPDDAKYAIDAIDGLNTKVQLVAALHRRGLPMVSCLGASSRLSPTAVRVGDIRDVRNCPLGRRVRQRLRRLGIDGGIRCVFSDEPVRPGPLFAAGALTTPSPGAPASLPALSLLAGRDAGVPELEAPEPAKPARRRAVIGSLSYVPGIVGLAAAGVIINDILGEAEPEHVKESRLGAT